MGQVSGMEYERVRRLADQVSEAAATLEGGRSALGDGPGTGFSLPNPFGEDSFVQLSTPFGNTQSARTCQAVYHEAQAAGGTATERLGAVLTADVERLGQVITCFQETDHESADQICAAGGDSLNVYSTHVHSHGSSDDDFVRAGQIDRLRDEIEGPAVIGADLNAEPDDDNRSSEAIADFEDHGYDVHSGGVDDSGEVVGTSSSGRFIDHVITSPTITVGGQPQLVDGGPSDHEGQRLDITVPDW